MFKRSLLILLPLLCSLTSKGNGLEISNLSINDDYTQATFDISWENSWRQTERFHDAVWVYLKYKPDNSGQWEHAKITGGTASGNLELLPQDDEMGIFVRNASDFAGNVTTTSITLDISLDSTIAVYPDFEVYGIEMVYVPEGPFFVGDGNNTSLGADSVFYDGSLYDTVGKDTYITLIDHVGEINFDYPEVRIPATYPNGYEAFYCMKYPFTQKQFVDFLNLLSLEDQMNIVQNEFRNDRPDSSYPFGKDYRQGIFESPQLFENNDLGGKSFHCNLNDDGTLDGLDDGQDLAASFRIDPRITATGARDAYTVEAFLWLLNWSGLRPMTSLEYEKAARGPLRPVKGEYAWGAPLSGGGMSISGFYDPGTSSEGYPDSFSSQTWIAFDFAYRVGMFAEQETDRIDAQASYWGIQDLSGNGYPLLISVKNTTFTNKNGSGSLNSYPLEWTDNTLFYESNFQFLNSRTTVSNLSPVFDPEWWLLTGGIWKVNFTLNSYNEVDPGILKGRGVRQP